MITRSFGGIKQDTGALPDLYPQAEAIAAFIDSASRLVVITGAGCSAPSGIPTYRDHEGQWQRAQPMQHSAFISSHVARQRYWTRSFTGWPAVRDAAPNAAHEALARLEAIGSVKALITQNVDGLHQKAGHKVVIDLHGRLDRVRCLACGETSDRQLFQSRLAQSNPDLAPSAARLTPDGDAEVAAADIDVPACTRCGGIIKPDVVFFGGSVPREVVESAYAAVDDADALLVIGSSLTVYSGYRFAKRAAALGKPVAILNQGKTRADPLASLKVMAPCEDTLTAIAGRQSSIAE